MAEYGEKSIQVLKGLEAVRKRPGMYIGSTGIDGLHHLIWEVLDNSIDEAMAGHCNKIITELHKDGSVSVEDNGRGIPVGVHDDEGIPAVQVVLTKLHAGGKFDEKAYGASGGLHGVGVSCVNALSEKLDVTVWRDSTEYVQSYVRGLAVTELKENGKKKKRGTMILFWPDPEIFTDRNFNVETIAGRIEELSYLNPNVSFVFKHPAGKQEFKSERGLLDYIEHIDPSKGIGKVITCSGSDEDIYVDVALKWSSRNKETELSFCNNINTHEGGTHLAGFRVAVSNAVMRNVLKDIKAKCKPIADDIKEGLTSIVSVRVPQPQFEGQTKTKLGTASVKGVVQRIVYEKLAQIFQDDEKLANDLAARIIITAKAREAAQRARDGVRKAAKLGADMLPGKLSDCQSHDLTESEIFLVEGDSAGGSAKQARDRRFQAILPLRGKILNVEGMEISKALKSKEIQTIVAAVGTGIGSGNFNPANLRYGKIIIMTDADVDGCLSGDTRVKLLDGTYPTMAELAGLYPDESTKFWVWANDGSGKHVPALAHSARVTRYVDKIYEVKLDDGTAIRATENHPFMLRTGKFVRADELVAGMSLMRMSWRLNGENGYNRNREEIYVPADKDQYPTHRYVASFFYDIDGVDVHHEDENPQNNAPENLRPIASTLHRSLHGKASNLVLDFNGSERQRAMLQENHRKGVYKKVYEAFRSYNASGKHSVVATKRNLKIWKDDSYRKHMKEKQREWLDNGGIERISKNTTNQWKDEKIAFRMQATRIVNVIKRALENHRVFNRQAYEAERPPKGVPTYDKMMQKMGFRNVIEAVLYAKDYNHKIVSVRLVELPESIPVYDITVDEYHNFLVCAGEGSGVFVHNSHIRALILTFFFRQMPELIINGNVYIAQPPLYKVKIKGKDKFIFNEAALKKEFAALPDDHPKPNISRYKGLGEMPPMLLWKTTMNPENRRLMQVRIEDAAVTDATFSMLMGNSVEARAQFINEQALNVGHLDV